VRRERAVRIIALVFGAELDPLQLQAPQPLGFLACDLSLHPKEAPAVIDGRLQLRQQVAMIQVQNFGKNVGGQRYIGDAQRIYHHRFGGQTHRQALAVAIQNRATRGFDLFHFLLLFARHLRELRMLDHLQLNQAGDNQRGP